ncbi:MAG: ATP phosphoribosyltransferase [Bacteroidaceae bacterium]
MLRIAVQSKGRLYEETMNMLSEADIKVNASKRKLLIQSPNFPVEILFLRDDDIPESVSSGIADIGIVGENEYAEKNKKANIVKRLGFSKCRLSIAIPNNIDYTASSWLSDKKIATSYPRILQEFLDKEGVENCEIHVITGSVEVSPSIGLADGIFDIVSSGSTLVTNRLKEVAVVMQSEALLISSPSLNEDKQAILDELLFRIDSVRNAQGKKYVMMNLPKNKIDKMVTALPGIKSPTILPLADSEWCSVHAVIGEDSFWQIITVLKEIGAEDILILPIEVMIP